MYVNRVVEATKCPVPVATLSATLHRPQPNNSATLAYLDKIWGPEKIGDGRVPLHPALGAGPSFLEYLDIENIDLLFTSCASNKFIMSSTTPVADAPHKTFDTILTLDFG